MAFVSVCLISDLVQMYIFSGQSESERFLLFLVPCSCGPFTFMQGFAVATVVPMQLLVVGAYCKLDCRNFRDVKKKTKQNPKKTQQNVKL